MEQQLLAEINRIYAEMQKASPSEDEYEKLMDRYAKLCELRTTELKTDIEKMKVDVQAKEVEKKNALNANDLIGAATNIAGIWAILNHEKLNVISTKALGFVKKLKF